MLQPLLTMLVFSHFFGRLARMLGRVPYPVFSIGRFAPLELFANSL